MGRPARPIWGLPRASWSGYARRTVLIGVLTVSLAFVASALIVSSVEAGGAYRLIDEDGVTHITDTPNDPRFLPLGGYASGTAAGLLRVPPGTRPGTAFGQEIKETAERYGVSPVLVEAVIRVESAFNPWAVSRKGAQGLMQLMPTTAATLGVRNSFDPRQNIEGGVRHLRYLLDRYPGNVPFALAAYNAGEGAVDSYRGIPPYPETQQYVQKVLERTGTDKQAPAPPKKTEPVQVIYRYEDNEGTLTFSNLPPVNRGPTASP